MRDLEKDLELIGKATPGPWSICREDIGDEYVCMTATEIYGVDGFPVVSCEGGLTPIAAHLSWDIKTIEANAEFIAEAREGWPEATMRAMKAEEENAELKIELTAARSRVVDLEKALYLACQWIWEDNDECPKHAENFDCDNYTSLDNQVDCWREYFLWKARGEDESTGKV